MVKTEEPSGLNASLAAALSSLHQKGQVSSEEVVDLLDCCSMEASLSDPYRRVLDPWGGAKPPP